MSKGILETITDVPKWFGTRISQTAIGQFEFSRSRRNIPAGLVTLGLLIGCTYCLLQLLVQDHPLWAAIVILAVCEPVLLVMVSRFWTAREVLTINPDRIEHDFRYIGYRKHSRMSLSDAERIDTEGPLGLIAKEHGLSQLFIHSRDATIGYGRGLAEEEINDLLERATALVERLRDPEPIPQPEDRILTPLDVGGASSRTQLVFFVLGAAVALGGIDFLLGGDPLLGIALLIAGALVLAITHRPGKKSNSK